MSVFHLMCPSDYVTVITPGFQTKYNNSFFVLYLLDRNENSCDTICYQFFYFIKIIVVCLFLIVTIQSNQYFYL